MPRNRKLTAGPTRDGTFISRRTHNDYAYAVAVIDRTERVYKRSHPDADERGYIPNPTLGQWVSFSWHTRRDLAVKSWEKAAKLGLVAQVVPVVAPDNC